MVACICVFLSLMGAATLFITFRSVVPNVDSEGCVVRSHDITDNSRSSLLTTTTSATKLRYTTDRALGSEIINGRKAPERSMLYMVSVQNRSNQHLCGGFLINEEFAVTAAHCDDDNPTSVVLGTHNLEKIHDGTMRYSIKTYKHPSYWRVGAGYDIMLLKLSRKVQLSSQIETIRLPCHEIDLKKKMNCSVAGWGFTKTGGHVVDDLQVVNVSLIDLEKCKEVWEKEGVFLFDAVCAGGNDSNKGFCQGDSGGPLVCNGVAVGVVSFNKLRNCNYPDVPNVYTDLFKYLPWIEKTLNQRFCQ